MSSEPTLMHQEVREIPAAIDRLLSQGGGAIRIAASLARDVDPRYFISIARGSSDHAASFLKYASELVLRRPMASVGPSVNSIYGVELDARGAVCISVSQSGQSPDIVRLTEALRDSGALTVAITNDENSRLGRASNSTLPIHAGPELSVAATKTFVASLVAGLWFLAEMQQETDLITAIHALPEALDKATRCDWSSVVDAIDGRSLFTIGRGPSWAISNEAALKFKETCLIHAESYSSAEVLHGPVSIVGSGFPVIAFTARDKAEASVAETADALAEKGARVFAVTNQVNKATPLPHVRTDHWLCDPIPAIVSFYAMVETVALARGINPDKPRHLNKVTETV
ncbi:MAG: SIS domain-containing protein [Paracoccaceae bacterium]|nr:SIS domain-containing protein [Paracoccaceae bacterium]